MIEGNLEMILVTFGTTEHPVKKGTKKGAEYGLYPDEYDPEDYEPLMFEAGKKRV